MNSSVKLGKIHGIEIGLNYTWLIAVALITWSLATGFFPAQFPGWSARTYWIAAAVSSLLLFASVLAHELTHSFVAQYLGLRVQSINLFIFGGVSNIVGEAKRARDELYISAVGPLSSLALAALFGIALLVFRQSSQPVVAILFYSAIVNALLAVFNLIPGFPLDGGRVFRAVVWGMTQDFYQSTRIATGAGKGIAYLLIFAGLFVAFRGDFLSGIWLAFIGWFLSEAADASYQQMVIQKDLRGVHVKDLMSTQLNTVSTRMSLDDVVERYVFGRSLRTLPVVDDGGLVGLLTLNEIRAVPRDRWPMVTVGEVMTPLDRLRTVGPQDEVSGALQVMGEEDVNQLPVVENGHLVGLLSRGNLIRFLQVRHELGGSRA